MSLYSLFDLSIGKIIADFCLGALTLSSLSILGKFLYSKLSFFSSILLGASLIASVVSGIVAINARIGRQFMELSVALSFIVGVMYFVILFYQKKIRLKINQDLIWIILLSISIISVSVFRLQYLNNGAILINAHEAYYAGIPIEINQANYGHRLRILDYYPAEWSKYHFFTSSLLAIAMSFMNEQNLASFLIAKSLIIVILFGVALENLKVERRIKSTLLISALLLYAIAFQEASKWSLNTTNFLSVGFLVLIFLSSRRNDYFFACFCSLGLSLSASRVIIPGMVLFIYFLFLMRKETADKVERSVFGLKFKYVLIYFTQILAILSVLIVGSLPSNIDSPVKSLYSFMIRAFFTPSFLFTSPDWQLSMSSSTGILRLLSSTPILDRSLNERPELLLQLKSIGMLTSIIKVVFWLLLIYLIYLKINIHTQRLGGTLFFRRMLQSREKPFFLIFGIPFSLWLIFSIIRDYENIPWPIFVTILPVLTLITLCPNGFRVPLILYLISSYLLVPFSDTSLWTATVSLPEFLLPLFLFENIPHRNVFLDSIISKWFIFSFYAFAILFSRKVFTELYFPNNLDTTSHLIKVESRAQTENLSCETMSDSEKLLNAISGKRVLSDPTRNDRFVVTKFFAVWTQENSRERGIVCMGSDKLDSGIKNSAKLLDITYTS